MSYTARQNRYVCRARRTNNNTAVGAHVVCAASKISFRGSKSNPSVTAGSGAVIATVARV